MIRVAHCFIVASLITMSALVMYKGITAPDDDPGLALRAMGLSVLFLTLALLRLPEALGARGRFDP